MKKKLYEKKQKKLIVLKDLISINHEHLDNLMFFVGNKNK
jgi:hypothetical protein